VARHFDLPIEEHKIRLDRPETYAEVREHSPSGLVPCLVDGDFIVGDSLAIIEYLADLYPEKSIWPKDFKARAVARSISAEMHSGFSQLRGTWPMDIINENKALSCPPGVAKDLRRIHTLWTGAREQYGQGGPFLFGQFSAADAMFAPVVTRIRTYGPVPSFAPLQEYMDAIWDLPAMADWRAEAHQEAKDGWYSD